MKTEKRLTMALSVLVALMMLAVPLASSSNLFVDGGQTNSNGDAPSLSATPSDVSSVSKYTWDDPAKDQIINTFIIDSEASYDMFIAKYGLTETDYGAEDKTNNAWKLDPWLAVIYQTKTNLTSLELSISNSNIVAKNLGESDNGFTLSGVDGKATISKSDITGKGTNNAIVVSLSADDLGISSDKFQGDYRITLKVNGTTLSDSVTYASPNDVKIIDSWIVYDQKSLDKIGNYVGKDIQNSNFGKTWSEDWNTSGAWIAIAYTVPAGVGSVDFTAQFKDGTKSTITTSVGNSNGTHVFTAFVNGTHADKDCFGLTGVNSETYPANYYGEYSVNVAGANSSYKFAFGSDATEQITITFNLNVPDSEGRISLDKVSANIIPVSGLVATFNYDPDNKNVVYVTLKDDEVSIKNLLESINPSKAGYNFISWTDENGVQYDSSMEDNFKKSMTLNANWEINDGFVQIPIDVMYDGTTYKYSLAMASIDGKTVNVSSSNIISLLPKEINDKGYIINKEAPNARALAAATLDTVYSYTVKENNADGKDLKSTGLVSMNSASSVFIEYSLTSYTKITVSCDIFGDEKAVMYAYNSNNYTYQQVWNALTSVGAADLGLKKSFGGDGNAALNKKTVDNKFITADGKYRILNWDSGVALDDTKTAPGVELRLNVELNGYNVIFMVNGQAQVVNIPYNQLTVDKCPFDVTGVNHWVYLSYDNYSGNGIGSFTPFNFNSQSDVAKINDEAKSVEEPQYVFIACFEKADNTAYAVFNASSNGIAGNYGNEYINKIIIPGKAVSGNNSTVIPLPAVQPVYESKNVLIGYVDSDKPYANTGDDASKYGVKDSVKVFDANVIPYKYTITFYNGSDVNGIFYYSGDSQTSNDSIATGLVAFSYNGTAYDIKSFNNSSANDHESAEKAFYSILYPTKDGYKVTQWKDSDGNVMLDKVDKNATSGIVSYEVKFKKISSDMSFYANFDAKEYTIVYSGNTATSTNEMKQNVKVDQNVNLFSDSTFSNDGFKLKEWNTRPDGKGTSYALGASFALNGEQFEDLKDGKFTLYAIWEKSGSTPGDNNEGNNDSNTDTYLLAGILVVIIILIILIAFLMKRKQ